MIKTLNHITFAVSDMDKSFIFYKDILGFTPIVKSEGCSYLLVGDKHDPNSLWIALDLDRNISDNIRSSSECQSHIEIAPNEVNLLEIISKRVEIASLSLAMTPVENGFVYSSLRGIRRIPWQSNQTRQSHIAFSVNDEDFTKMEKRIKGSGAIIYKENISEGKSLYFLDPDSHKLEIHVGDIWDRVKFKKENAGNWKNVRWFV